MEHRNYGYQLAPLSSELRSFALPSSAIERRRSKTRSPYPASTSASASTFAMAASRAASFRVLAPHVGLINSCARQDVWSDFDARSPKLDGMVRQRPPYSRRIHVYGRTSSGVLGLRERRVSTLRLNVEKPSSHW